MGFKFKLSSLLNKGSNSHNDIEPTDSKPLETFHYINEFASQLTIDGNVFSPLPLSSDQTKHEVDLVFENIKKIFFDGDYKKAKTFVDYLSRVDLTKKIIKYLILNGPCSHLNLFIDFLHSDFLFYRENGKLFCNIKIVQLVVYQNDIKDAPVDVSIDLEWKDGAFILSTADKLIRPIESEEEISFLTLKKRILLKLDKIIANKKIIDKFSQLRYLSESKFEVSDSALLKKILAWIKKIEETKEAEITALSIDNLCIIYYIADIAHVFLETKLSSESKTLIKDKLYEFITGFNFFKNYEKKSIEEIENFLLGLKRYINDPQDNDLSGLIGFQIPKEGFLHKAMNVIRAVKFERPDLRYTSQAHQAQLRAVADQVGSNSLLIPELNVANEQDKKLNSAQRIVDPLEQGISCEKQEVADTVEVLKENLQIPETPAGHNESHAFLGDPEDKKLLPGPIPESYSPKSDVLSEAIEQDKKLNSAQRIVDPLEQGISCEKQEVADTVEALKERPQIPKTPAGRNESYAFLEAKDKKLLPRLTPESYSPESDVLSEAILEKYTKAEGILNQSLNIVNTGINPDYNYSPVKFFEFLQAIALKNADKEVKILLEAFFKSFNDMKEKLISAVEYYVAQHYALAESIDYYNDFYYFERSRGVSFCEENVFAKEKKLGELKLNEILSNIVLQSFSLISVKRGKYLSLPDFFLESFNKAFNDKFFTSNEIECGVREEINSYVPSFFVNQLSFQELLQCNFDKIVKEVASLNETLSFTKLPISFFKRLKEGIFLGEKRLTLLKESIYRNPAETSYEEKVAETVAQLKNLTRFKLFFKYRIFFWSRQSKEAVFAKINKYLISSIYEEKLNRIEEAKCDLEKALRQYNNTLKESRSIANNFVKLVGMLNSLIAYTIPQHLSDSPNRLTEKEMIETIKLFTLPMSFWWNHCLERQEKEINDHMKKLETRKNIILNHMQKLFQNLKKACPTEESSNAKVSNRFSTHNGLGLYTISGKGHKAKDGDKIIYPGFKPNSS